RYGASALLGQGELDQSAAALAKARAIFERRGNLPRVALVRTGLAMVQTARGELDAAEAELKVTLGELLESARTYAAFPLQTPAEIAIARGRLDEARRYAAQTRDERRSALLALFGPSNLLQLAEISLEEGRRLEAIRLAQEVAAIGEGRGIGDFTAMA